MKKTIVSASMRKWIVGGSIFFGGTALLTTGFATWLVGATQTAESKDINVKVDTATNESVILEVNLSDADIKLVEPAAITTGLVKTSSGANDVDPKGLQIAFSKITATWGQEYDGPREGVKFSLPVVADEVATNIKDNTNNFVTDDADLIDKRELVTSATTYSYIEAPVELNFAADKQASKCVAITENNMLGYVYTDLTVEFTRGSFFGDGNVSPATYYNGIYANASLSEKVAASGNVSAELNAMHTALDGKTLVLKMELI